MTSTPAKLVGSKANNYISVRELCSGKEEALRKMAMDDSIYKVPTFSWKKPKFSNSRVKKLDYISVFAEHPVVEPGKLIKIFAKKKHTVPGPDHYDMIQNWTKRRTSNSADH